MNLSVVVATYDRTDDMVECVRSLRSQFEPPGEIVIVDDGAYSQTADRLATEGLLGAVTHIEGPANGLPAARNAGVDAAAGDIVAFVDDDVILPPNWTRELKRTYEEFPQASGVGGYVLNYNPEQINKANVESPGYRLLQAFRRVFLQRKVGQISPVGILWAPHVFMTSHPRRVDALQGCNMSFRAEVFEDHRFDEWYGTSGSSAGEELDFAASVTSDGSRLVYDPRLVAIHKRTIGTGPKGRGGDPNYGNIANLGYFVLKHPDMTFINFALLTVLVSTYSLVKLDGGYLRGLLSSAISYYRENGSEAYTPDGE